MCQVKCAIALQVWSRNKLTVMNWGTTLSLLCSDCLITLISMLSRLSLTTFVECIASTTLLLSITASIGIDCGDNNKISSISDAKR